MIGIEPESKRLLVNTPPSVAIVGGGIAGLFAGYRLALHGVSVTLFEASEHLGGLLAWEKVGDADLELFYHHMFVDDHFLINAMNHLGIPIDWTVTRTGFVGGGVDGVAEFSAPQHLLSFSFLSPSDRLRLGYALARVTWEWKRSNGTDLDKIGVAEWLRSLGCQTIYNRFFATLVEKKFGSAKDRISAAWLVGRLGMRSGRTFQGERLGYPRRGFRSLVDGLHQGIVRMGGKVRTQDPVEALVIDQDRVSGVKARSGMIPVQAVVATASPSNLTTILEGTGGLDEEASGFRRLPYQRALTVLLGLERPVSDFYWLNVMDSSAPFGAIVDHSNLRPMGPYGGPVIYLASYPDTDDAIWEKKDQEIVDLFVSHLKRVVPFMKDNGTRWSRVVHTNEASLVYECGVRDLLPPRQSRSVGGLYYAGMFRCYPLRKINLVGSDACATSDLLVRELLNHPDAPARTGSSETEELPTQLDL